jgi:hypothetical protein
MSVIYPTPTLPKWNSGSGAVWIHRVAIGSGLRATVDMAKPTKEDKIRRKARKPSASQIRNEPEVYSETAMALGN